MARDRMLAAAVIIANEAKRLAAIWSVQVPPSIRVSAAANSAVISSGVGPSYPNEVKRVRHPVFGGRGTSRENAPWVTNEYRPFLAPAAEAKAQAAAEEIAKTVDDLARQAGFIT
jgi:hypothetical protein